MKSKKIILVIFYFLLVTFLHAQNNLLKVLDTVTTKYNTSNKVTSAFTTTKIISMQSPQTEKAGQLDFRITHRFGNIGSESDGGVHTLYGWDAISDMRIAFDYGITDKFQIGVARNKRDENIDGSIKWRFLQQTLDNKMPLSICLYAITSLTPMKESQLFSGADSNWVAKQSSFSKFEDRIKYTTQLILARKFSSRLSLAITPSYTHRNYVFPNINPYNNTIDENNLFAVGIGARFKVSKHFSILADYFYVKSDYRKKNPANPYYNPLAVGIEIETGGHVFHVNFTNADGITENYLIPNSPDSWTKGGYKFGFNISRTFQITGKKKKEGQ